MLDFYLNADDIDRCCVGTLGEWTLISPVTYTCRVHWPWYTVHSQYKKLGSHMTQSRLPTTEQ